MANLVNLTKSDTKPKYSDGINLEKKMLEYAKGKKVSFKANEKWPVFYHFSKYREGILNWYPFKKDCTILEIGSGCGAITNLLCLKARKVVSIELEYSRALINYERNNKNDNLEIIAGDINKIKLKDKFDYVILNGVLEYAQSILDSDDDNAYSKLLKKAKSLLNKDGIMLLAIENRLGLKYLTGSKEDHLNSIYSGINGYKDARIKTFSKQELIELLHKSGLKDSKWYYPFPDYKFPFEIFTDKSINNIYPCTISLPLDFDQIELIDSNSLYRSFMKNAIMENFANSFLVEINNTKDNGLDYIKLSTIRKDKFSIYTTINYKKNLVSKHSTFDSGLNHIKNICENNYFNSLLKTLNYEYRNNKCECKLIKGNTLQDEILDDNSKLIPTVKMIYDSLINGKPTIKKINKSFIEVFGDAKLDTPLHWIKNINIDLQLSNIYSIKNNYVVIDPEWQFDFYVPVEYIVWRILFNLPQIGICDRKDIKKQIKYFGIDPKLCDIFLQMELHFVFTYVGYKELPYKKLKHIDINSLIKQKAL